MAGPILILGGYGVFGGYLARALVADGHRVVVAGRSLSKAAVFGAEFGAIPARIDLTSERLAADIADFSPFVVVDAAGPYQAYGVSPYRVAEAAIACGAHYLDLSDDAGFTAGISALDAAAQAAGVCVLSGVSSVPALSSAIAADLIRPGDTVDLIESAILPGNRAPRGRSVMASILAQTGRPLKLWRDGRWTEGLGWGDVQRRDLKVRGVAAISGRWTSMIGAPDLALFPQAFGARSVLFRAGLDLKLMHGGLAALGWLVQRGVIRRLTGWTGALKWAADRLERFGSDRGGMLVRVVVTPEGGAAPEARTWTLIAEAGDGPKIPAIPAQILIQKLTRRGVEAGARPALMAFTRAEAEAALGALNTHMGVRRAPLKRVFAQALGPQFETLPLALKTLHSFADQQVWQGTADVTRGTGILSRLIGWMTGFPKAASDVPVTVTQTRRPGGERWVRVFDGRQFVSNLSRPDGASDGVIYERFGPLRFEIALEMQDGALTYPVVRGWCLGVPLPRALLPVSQTREYAISAAETAFDVSIALPLVGPIVHYRGQLRRIDSA